jgi:hypothetical protein
MAARQKVARGIVIFAGGTRIEVIQGKVFANAAIKAGISITIVNRQANLLSDPLAALIAVTH